MSTNDTKQKKKHIKAVRPKLRLFRAKEPLWSVFMWGVNHSITELTHIAVPVMLMPDDFKAHTKVKIDNHLYNKENMPSHFKVKEYCPLVFRNLRERFLITDTMYLDSLTRRPPVEYDASGRSGARLMRSHDSRFIIKTMSSEQVAEMHHILKSYHQYIVERAGETLLPQFVGMYRLTVSDTETYLAVQSNVLSTRRALHKKYDLKGSKLSREASDKEKTKELPTLKDNDLISEGTKVVLGPENKEKFMVKLKADVEFLAQLNLMDYSLLVGIHDPDLALDDVPFSGTDSEEETGGYSSGGAAPTPPESPQPAGGAVSPAEEQPTAFTVTSGPERNETYFMGLIDILTHYGMKKRSAAAAKTMKYGSAAEISTVHPEQYMKRFLEFIDSVIE